MALEVLELEPATQLATQLEQTTEDLTMGVLRLPRQRCQQVDRTTARVLVQLPAEQAMVGSELVGMLVLVHSDLELQVLAGFQEPVASAGGNSAEWEEASVNGVSVVHLAVAWAASAGVRVATAI